MDEQLLDALNKTGMEEVLKKLHAFTYFKLQTIAWPSKKESGPKGEECHDFVNEALRLSLDLSEKRKWKPRNCPDPIAHLCKVIQGLISNALNKADKDTSDEVDDLLELADNNIIAEDQLVSAELEEVKALRFNSMENDIKSCLLYTSPSPRDRTRSRMPSSA